MKSSFRLLDKRRTIAGPGFNRWLVPPAALCVHLCIGMAYGFSVFWLPLTKAVGITQPVVCPDSLGLFGRLTATTLIKWFPDHRGLATGLAIMGFGGGARRRPADRRSLRRR
jgi:hypothetical protein